MSTVDGGESLRFDVGVAGSSGMNDRVGRGRGRGTGRSHVLSKVAKSVHRSTPQVLRSFN